MARSWCELYLGADGSLSETEQSRGSASFGLRRGAVGFDYRFDQETELSGPMTVRLTVTVSGNDDPRLFVGVEKWSGGAPVPFEGSYGYGRDRVAVGRLRLALRELDRELSTPHQPEHSFRTLQPIRPGEPVQVVIPLTSSSTLFRAGDSLRLLIAGRYLEPRNPAFGHFPAHYVASRGCNAALEFGSGRTGALEIPIVP